MKKRIIMAVLCLSLGVGSTALAATGPDPGTAGIQRAEECGNCGSLGTVHQEKKYTEWIKSSESKPCRNNQNLLDYYYVRSWWYQKTCSKCGYYWHNATQQEKILVCPH